ncbi:hypothetical protein C7M84_012358 [Penaeus vannamei]|uniref:Uncharacterized protein n=1 Tax=Penaeus vannamei TaxID=6689 RepID=A0A3R7SPF6_PENVA|nr:hypothetical protein C7M84_012358 [Penaeus vannamei]
MVAGLILSRWRRGRAKGSLAGASGAFLAWCGAPGPSEGRSLRGERGQGGGRPFGRMTRAERVAAARATAVSGPCPVPPRFPSLAPGRGTVPAPFLWWALWHFSPPLLNHNPPPPISASPRTAGYQRLAASPRKCDSGPAIRAAAGHALHGVRGTDLLGKVYLYRPCSWAIERTSVKGSAGFGCHLGQRAAYKDTNGRRITDDNGSIQGHRQRTTYNDTQTNGQHTRTQATDERITDTQTTGSNTRTQATTTYNGHTDNGQHTRTGNTRTQAQERTTYNGHTDNGQHTRTQATDDVITDTQTTGSIKDTGNGRRITDTQTTDWTQATDDVITDTQTGQHTRTQANGRRINGHTDNGQHTKDTGNGTTYNGHTDNGQHTRNRHGNGTHRQRAAYKDTGNGSTNKRTHRQRQIQGPGNGRTDSGHTERRPCSNSNS